MSFKKKIITNTQITRIGIAVMMEKDCSGSNPPTTNRVAAAKPTTLDHANRNQRGDSSVSSFPLYVKDESTYAQESYVVEEKMIIEIIASGMRSTPRGKLEINVATTAGPPAVSKIVKRSSPPNTCA